MRSVSAECWRGWLRFSPKGVVEVSVEGLVGAVAAQHSHDVPPKEAAAAPKSKDRRELCGQKEKFSREELTEDNFQGPILAQFKVCPASCRTGEDEESFTNFTLTCANVIPM